MGAMGVDPALGGADSTAIATHFDYWFAPLVMTPGRQTPNPSDVVALIQKHWRHGAEILVDCDGGCGSGIVERLRESGREGVKPFKGSMDSNKRRNRTDGFTNKRAEAYFKLADALSPDQPGGSRIALPNDPALKADLCAVRYRRNTSGELQLESKQEIRKRIGRSPDHSDAVAMAYFGGMDPVNRALTPGVPGTLAGGGRKVFKRPQQKS
jgi:hypothetical protein